MHPLDQFLHVAKESALIGGDILNRGFRKLLKDQIRLKGIGDYVTELDHASERAIVENIRKSFPSHQIIAEESGVGENFSPYRWYIDPLDGTTNYVHHVAIFSISVAVSYENETLVGVVYDPYHKEMFWAIKGQGAFLNGMPIRVSEKKELQECFLASGFPWRSKMYLDAYLNSFRDLFNLCAGIRRLGSAALDLSYTACGRFDGFWEMKLKPWDIAAGVLILEEAGGKVSDFRGENHFMKSGNVVAGNPLVFPMILEIVKKHLSGID